jgi:hypothetical protein
MSKKRKRAKGSRKVETDPWAAPNVLAVIENTSRNRIGGVYVTEPLRKRLPGSAYTGKKH